MIKKIIAIVLFSFSFSLTVSAQDDKQITSVIEDYFYGYIHRDSVRLVRAFDMVNGAMKVPGTFKDGKEYVANDPFNSLIPNWYSREKLSAEILESCKLTIKNIDLVEDKIASAKIHMKVGETTYIDILSLQKINKDWKITNKIFVVADK